jgi:hypothetical protein
VTRLIGTQTPSGLVNWTSDSSGSFSPNPCTLAGADGISTCTANYTPREVGSSTHKLTASYAGDTFLAPSIVSQNVTVVQRPVTVTADPKTKVFGDPDPLLTYKITEGNLVFSDTFVGSLTRESGEDVGQDAILQGSLALTIDYNLDYLGDDLTITRADPTCSIDGYTGVFDRNPHGASGSCTGVNGEVLAGLDLGASFSDVPGGAANWVFTDVTGNYKDASGTAEIVINKAEASCSVIGFTGVYDGNPYGATGTCSGIGGENPGSLDLGETFKDVPGGTAHWNLTGNSNYNNLSGDASIVIIRAEAVCLVTPYVVEYDRKSHTATGICTGVLGEELTGLDLTGTAHTALGSYPGDPWTFSNATGNYNDVSGSVKDEITIRTITVTADAKYKDNGQPDPELTYQVTSGLLLADDSFSGALIRQPGEKAGTYPILQGSLSLPDYYAITYVHANFTITGWTIYLLFIHR